MNTKWMRISSIFLAALLLLSTLAVLPTFAQSGTQDEPATVQSTASAVTTGTDSTGAYKRLEALLERGGVESTYCGVIASETVAEGIFVPENGNLGSLGYIPSESTAQYPHLHLEIRVNGTITDPLEVMGRD